MIIYSLWPVSVLSDSAQRKTNPKSEMTQYKYNYCVALQCFLTSGIYIICDQWHWSRRAAWILTSTVPRVTCYRWSGTTVHHTSILLRVTLTPAVRVWCKLLIQWPGEHLLDIVWYLILLSEVVSFHLQRGVSSYTGQPMEVRQVSSKSPQYNRWLASSLPFPTCTALSTALWANSYAGQWTDNQ